MKKSLIISLLSVIAYFESANAQGVTFPRDFSPAEGLIISQEQPYRQEICLNGYWDLQIVNVPSDWQSGMGIAPELPKPLPDKWEDVKIKIPSPINVNNWGGGQNVGEGTNHPYAPSSVYYPSYPRNWVNTRMAWLKKEIIIPSDWNNKTLMLHFEAVAGECVLLVNGVELARNFDAWLPFDANITNYIKKDAPNEILLGLRHTRLFDKKHPDYRHFGATYPSGSNTDDLIGIWQDVFLYAVPEIHVTDVFVKPWLNRDELEIEAQVVNLSAKKTKIRLEGDIKEWLNLATSKNVLDAPEINWTLGNTTLSVSSKEVEINPGETKTIVIKTPVGNRLKKWSPDHPNLYTVLFQVKNNRTTIDCKATRFGWRQFTIEGKDFHLNGEKIQCFGDIQHPFGPFICSRRFAWAWYQMIKDFGGNAVRPHAQPWPRVYYQLADEMGLMVLDETALFGSSIRLNLEEEQTWERSFEHLKRLILRDRNYPSVVGWSAGNEMFAIALLNKPPKEVSDKWDDRLVELTWSAKQYDTTRDFITLDGDRDMDGRLPVWSKHFGHDLRLNDLPQELNKPLIVGECGATYYGRPSQLYSFSGDKAFQSYYGRNMALAIDIYQNVVQMARPHLAYFSPSEVCWFGIEHLNLGYRDFSRLPNLNDGIFSSKPYIEGKPGYQFERIPPYVTTFNPGLDSELPLYKPLPMFEAMKAALAQPHPLPCAWDKYEEIVPPPLPEFPEAIYQIAFFAGDENGKLAKFIHQKGIQTVSDTKTPNLLIIDAETVSQHQMNSVTTVADRIRKSGGLILVMSSGEEIASALNTLLPAKVNLTNRRATALENNHQSTWGKYFRVPDLYFAEQEGDKYILKKGLSGELVEKGTVVFQASGADWSLFNNTPENRKCAQAVLYEHLEKEEGAALVTYRMDNATLAVSVLDFRLDTKETSLFWKNLFAAMKINTSDSTENFKKPIQKPHDLLLDGPIGFLPIHAPRLTDYIDPYIGSGGHGHVFVGASVPFGAVQVGPSNFYKGWDWCSGYNYQDSVIIGFPQLHLSGTGIGDLGDILIMPYMGEIKLNKGVETKRYSGYSSKFSHDNETVRPGYYAVKLDDYGVEVELTASERVGFHKYKFPKGKDARIIIDLKDGINDRSTDTYIELVDKYTIKGYRSSSGWAKRQQVFFAIRSSLPIQNFAVYDNEKHIGNKKGQGESIRGLISFAEAPDEISLKVGISPVSANNALANIQAEIPHWDFDKIRIQADDLWEKELAKITVETADEMVKKIFYTSMFHLMIQPTLFNDHNGDYMGSDWKIYKKPSFANYTIFSLWDTYRAAHPLFTITNPDRVSDFVNSMLAIFDQTGTLPIWHLRGYETGTMVGINSFQVIAEAYLKGCKGFDAERAYNALKTTAMSDIRGLNFVKEFKPIPSDEMRNRPVAMALELAIGDASIALMAKSLGKTEDYEYFKKRAENYKLYYDDDTGFFRGKMSNGEWNPVFDPMKSKRPYATDYAEGNAWQYLWLAPQDVYGLIDLLGGEDAFLDRFDTFFSLDFDPHDDVLVDLTGNIGQYAHGNEPGHHNIYMYAYAGQQWKTARLARRVMNDFYTDQPDGIIGNEDCGQMSAWYIFSALGFYPVFTASGEYVIGSPALDKATINLENGKQFIIETINNSPENIYIQSITMNGKDYPYSYITHKDIVNGGTMTIQTGKKPNYKFGKEPENRPGIK